MERAEIEAVSRDLVGALRQERQRLAEGSPTAGQSIREIEDKLVRLNAKLAVNYSRTFARTTYLDPSDCLSEAFLGLLRAIRIAPTQLRSDSTFEILAKVAIRSALLTHYQKACRRERCLPTEWHDLATCSAHHRLDSADLDTLDAAEEILERRSDLDSNLLRLVRRGHSVTAAGRLCGLKKVATWHRWEKVRTAVRAELFDAVYA